ncbi:MAG: hypothetical protein AYK23_03815 [Candidatus Proteinoplasmatales archaeon SG8-5]|nr:MAG: hypothetical protein AYK23_03815 [Candidatus Proteinoplasmatales archaeon SG8-5]
MTACQKCSKDSVIHIDYSGADLCADHFIQFVEKRVQKELKLQGKLPKDTKLAVAVSGGKDSMSLLHILHDIFKNHRGVSLVVLSVDEGLKGYRENAIGTVSMFCQGNGIPHELLSFKDEFGIEMDDVAEKGGEHKPCTYCGVLRRSLLNRRARELGAAKIALGHNLDDMAQSIMMNVVNGDVHRLLRLAPHALIQPGFVPRIVPMRTIPEAEIRLYAELKDVPHLERHCPYRPKAHRLGFLEIIDQLEERTPGTKHSILSTYDQIIEPLRAHYPPADLLECNQCGEPSMGDECKACELIGKLRD